MIEFNCPECKSPVSISESDSRSAVNCPECGDRVQIPRTSVAHSDTESQVALTTGVVMGDSTGVHHLRTHRRPRRIPWSMLAAFAFTAAFYAVLRMHESIPYLGQMFAEKFTQRGWTPYAATFLAFWSVSICLGKLFVIRSRSGSLRQEYIPPNNSLETDAEIESAICFSRKTSEEVRDSIIGYRIRRGLERFRATRNVSDAGELLQEESDADYGEMESSYSMVRVFLWSIPIFGFIGTVMGVGSAVNEFAGLLGTAQEVAQIKEALGGVTGGLGVAFDTTLIALALSIVVILVMTAVEKMERDQLQVMDDYCRFALLRRLPVRKDSTAIAIQEALDRHIKTLNADVERWQGTFRSLAHEVGQGIVTGVRNASNEWLSSILKASTDLKDSLDSQRDMSAQSMKLVVDAQSGIGGALDRLQALIEQDHVKRAETHKFETDQQLARIRKVIEMLQKPFEQLQMNYEQVEKLMALQNRIELRLTEMESRLSSELGDEGLAGLMGEVRSLISDLDPFLKRLATEPIGVEVSLAANSMRIQ